MAPSFSTATRLDDGYEYNAFAASDIRARPDFNGSIGEPTGITRNGVVVVDYSQRKDGSPDRYSYHTPYLRSSYPIPLDTCRNESPQQYSNDSIQRLDDSQDKVRPQKDASNWNRDDFLQPSVKENFSQKCEGKSSGMNKHGSSQGSYHRSESGHDLFDRRSSRHEVQPGFQCIQYYAKFDSKPKTRATMIEVSPGEFLRLRGADETWKAIHDDFYVPSACVLCGLTLFCIQDAVFVLCPECLIVSPLEGVVYDGYDGGVGIGFTMANLANWQEEIRLELNQGEGRM